MPHYTEYNVFLPYPTNTNNHLELGRHLMDSVVKRRADLVCKVDAAWNSDSLPDVDMNINERLLNVHAAFAVNLDLSTAGCDGDDSSNPIATWRDFTSVFDAADITITPTDSGAAASSLTQNNAKETNAANVL